MGEVELDWREDALHRIVGWTLVLGSVLAAFLLVSSLLTAPQRLRLPLFWSMMGVFLCLGVLRSDRISYSGRAHGYVALLAAIGTLALLNVGFEPGPILVYALAVVSAGLFIGQPALLLTLAVTTAGLVACGAAARAGHVTPWSSDASSTYLARAALAYAVTCGCLGILAHHVVGEVERAVAERRRAELALRERERMSAMGELLSGVAHEVRNPLFALSAILDALAARYDEDEGMRRSIDMMRQETQRLKQLMDDLLDFGRPAVDDIGTCRVDELVSEAFAACEPLARGRTVRLDADIDAELPTLAGDRHRLSQVFRNLVDNAIRHSEDGGRVAVQASPRPRGGRPGVACSVMDRGPGFGEEDLPRLFEPFFTRRPGGVGIGLALVRRIVVGHQGSVQAENRREGGAVVSVWLPAGGADPADRRPS
jgi:signal transduction histidine kinase